jgi:hypothetical protein
MKDSADNTNIGENNKVDRARDKLQVINTLILAIATLAITWCSYQGVLWNGIQTFKLGDSNKFARLSQQKTIVTGQNRAMDEAILIGFVKAAIEKNQRIVDYSLRGVRPELSKIMSEWISSRPFENPTAYPHPMAMPEYIELMKKDMAEADKLSQQAEESRNEAQKANNNSDNYSLLTVVFSMVMFLGAITSKIAPPRLSLLNTIAAAIICTGALVFVFFIMPIATK